MIARLKPFARGAVADNVGLAITLTLIFAVLAPTSETAAKFLGHTIPATEIGFLRFAIQLVIFAAFLGLAVPRGEWRPRPLWPLVVRGIFAALGTICVYAGLAVLPMVDAVAIFFIQPLILTALSALVLGDRVGRLRWFAVCAGMTGAVLIIGPNFAAVGWGAMFPALAALFHGCSGLMARRWAGLARLSVFQFYAALVAVGVTSAALIGGWLSERPELAPRMITDFELVLVAVVALGSTGSTLMLTQALRIAPPSIVAPYLYVHIVWSTVMGFIFFGHVPSPRTLAGAGLVIGAGLLVWWREARR
jgi:drug/metabolite transporter (DMT)-like permease